MQSFTVTDDEVTAQAAAAAYVWRRFRARAGWFVAGAVMWSAAIVYFSRSEGRDWFVGVFAVFLVFTVAYLPIFHFAFRRAAAVAVRRTPSRHVTVGNDKIEVSTSESSISLPWAHFRAVWEYPTFLVLPFLQVGFWWLPKRDLPTETLELIRRSLPRE
jgi:YcxB-like protein